MIENVTIKNESDDQTLLTILGPEQKIKIGTARGNVSIEPGKMN